jgi:hypothetical protein
MHVLPGQLGAVKPLEQGLTQRQPEYEAEVEIATNDTVEMACMTSDDLYRRL